MRIGILTVQIPFIRGGAEALAESLLGALRRAGHEAEIMSVPFKWYPPEAIPQQILACRLLDPTESSGMRVDRVIGLKFPAYLMPHPDKVLWLLHQHRPAYDLWDSPFGDMRGVAFGDEARRAIHEADTRLLPEARRIHAISRNVAGRLRRYNQLEATPLYHPPPAADRLRAGEDAGFFLFPSRLNGPKRQDLVVEALFRVRSDVRVCFLGAADSPPYEAALRARAASLPAGRALFLGHVPEARKLELYATCRAVVFPPFDEDYGYVSLEAMLSAKPVITCTDSGGSLEFVLDGVTGLAVAPDAGELARAMDHLWNAPALARSYGRAGRARYDELGISWENVVRCLLG